MESVECTLFNQGINVRHKNVKLWKRSGCLNCLRSVEDSSRKDSDLQSRESHIEVG